MTADRLRDRLALLGWSARELAAQTGVHERQARRMVGGEAAIPQPIAAWLERLARFHERNPAPAKTERNGQEG
jgi:plasmid maintenance system antidote protein VapI